MKRGTILIAAIALLLPLLAASCGGGDPQVPKAGAGSGSGGGAATSSATSGSGGSAAPPIPLGDLCPVFINDLCVFLTQCAGEPYKDIDHCKAEVDCYGLQSLTTAAAAGQVGYDPTQVGACNARFLDDPCHFGFFLFTPDIYDVLSYCPGTISPNVRLGGACDSNGQCAEGYCLKAGGVCPGTCSAYAKAGESCANGLLCDASQKLFCDADTCRPYAKAGDSCQTSTDCGPNIICIDDPACQPLNLSCDASGTCSPYASEGATCGAVPSTDGGTGTNQVFCAADLFCDAVFIDQTGTCRELGGEGAPCNTSGCAQGFHCTGYVPVGAGATLGKCSAPAVSGDACTGASDCQTGLQCDTGVCAPLLGQGDACIFTASCQSGLTCSDSVCLKGAYPGDPCDASSPCILSLCKDGKCVDHAKVGAACTADTDCTTGACLQGTCADTSVCQPPP